jgi:hypothetical protein
MPEQLDNDVKAARWRAQDVENIFIAMQIARNHDPRATAAALIPIIELLIEDDPPGCGILAVLLFELGDRLCAKCEQLKRPPH